MAAKVKVRRPSSGLPGAAPRSGLGDVQLGQSGLKRSYGYVYEELLPQLQGRRAISVYQEMSQNSAVIGAMLFAIDMFMRKVPWRVEAASDSDADKEKAKFLESCKDDMEQPWPDFIAEVNTMLPFGWSWFEIVYKQRFNDITDEFGTSVSQWNDGMVGWKKFMPISQESWWRWDFDPATGKTIGMWQRPAPDYSERYLPIGKSLHFRTVSRKDNPEGASILRTAYRAWYFLKRIEEIEAIGVERDLAGIPIATVPAEMLGENASQDDQKMVASIINLVQNVRRDQQEGIVWPQAYDSSGKELYTFDLLTSGGTRQFPTTEIISRYETRIAMTALADFLLLGSDASSNGSYALATSKSSMFQSALETWLNIIENVLNDRAVPLLFRQNGINSGPYPKFRHDIVQKPTLPDLATLISSMAGAGAQLFPDVDLENHIREFAELPIRETNDVNRGLEEKILNQELDTLLAESTSQQQLAERAGKDAQAEGVAAVPIGSIVQRTDPVAFKPPAQGAGGGSGASAGATPAGTGGKQPGSKKGAPTKSTGPVKSKLPPASRRSTISTRAGQGAPTKSTGGMKNRSVAKGKKELSRVESQLAPDYPQNSMDWMSGARWEGPVEMPISSLDFQNEHSWAAHHEPEKVDKFAKKIRQGKLKPIVAVKVPGSKKLRIVDGHHHALAYRKTGVSPVVWIGHVKSGTGPWDEMHSHQRVESGPDASGYEPGDKGGVKKYRVRVSKKSKLTAAGGIAVRAADTGRVLMLQRGLDHKDPASGSWEFPGGRRNSMEESPESAGIREWQEETGLKLPKGKLTGHWSSKDNVYHGIVHTVPNEDSVDLNGGRKEVVNPDGDDRESLAWWDPKHLKDHPALRKQLRRNLKELRRALKSNEELKLAKSATVSKESVHYRTGTPLKNCGNCSMFRLRGPDFETGACTLVKGIIDKNDVCDEWEAEPVSKSTDVAMRPAKYKGNTGLDNKKCDYCKRDSTTHFVQKSTGGILARSCQIHVPQAKAEIRWMQNNQVSPNNPMPYEPFPRVLTQ